MGSMDSWLYDLQALYSITLTGQFSILMLIEQLELKGFTVIVANTDGIEVLVPTDRETEFEQICKDWEKITGYLLEGDEYSSIYMSTVNDYVAFYVSGKMKVKGDFISDFDIWKNKSFRVVALAVQEYFKNGTDPKNFIQEHKNIYDFCIMAKTTGQLHLEMQRHGSYDVTKEMLEAEGWTFGQYGWITSCMNICSEENEKEAAMSYGQAKSYYLSKHPIETKQLKKLVRYYLSDNSEWQLYKRGTGSTGKPTNININAPNEIGNIYIQYFNQFEEKDNYHINKNQYIFKAYKLIDKIEKTRKASNFVNSLKPQIQTSLF